MLFTVTARLEHLYRRPAYEVEPMGTQGPASHVFVWWAGPLYASDSGVRVSSGHW